MSDSSSPPRKRRRMSSPTYDDQLAFPSQDELRVIGQLEISLSQVSSHYRECASKVLGTRTSSPDGFGLEGPPRASKTSDRPVFTPPSASFPRQPLAVDYDDLDDPFASTSGSFTGFIPANALNRQYTAIDRLPPDPETGQNEHDIAVGRMEDSTTPNIGFTSASSFVASSAGFTSASALAVKPVSVTRHGLSPPQDLNTFEDCAQTEAEFDSFKSMPDNASHNPFSMFTSLGKQKKLFEPSAAAMKTALERAKRWAVEDDDPLLDPRDDTPEKTPDVAIVPRQALLAVENVPPLTSAGPTGSDSTNQSQSDVVSRHANMAYNVVDLPRVGEAEGGATFLSAAHFSTPSLIGSRPVKTSSTFGMAGNAFTKPFKSPLVNPSSARNSENLQHTPSLFNAVASTPTKGPKTAALGSFFSVANTGGSRFSSPMPVRGTPIRKVQVKKFVTPFKPGMRPGEPGHSQLKARHDAENVNTPSGPSARVVSSMIDGSRKPTRRRFFDLSVVQGRKTLSSSGFRPGVHGPGVLANMGINVAEFSLRFALQHRFHISPDGIPSSDSVPLHSRGSVDALRELKAAGCHLATQEWVDNHWSLILWKLAGMAAFDPESEADVDRRRWSCAETIRQLKYRYEKELNCGTRPALRLIAAQDVSTGLHMILCVSGIIWSESGIGNDGLPLVPHPTLELTDGWYRLRTRVDEVLARAARRGVIRVGRKIAVSGASLSRNTEPCEVLEAYGKVELNIAGNGTHPAPWHAKLGFQLRPAIATLHTLSPDGGTVPCLQLVVTKVYPIAFIEFCKDSDGNVTREGPRREKEEQLAQDAWARKREREYQRLRKELEDKQNVYLDWARRFEIKSGGEWHPGDDDDMPDHIESMFDDCENSSDASPVLRRASKNEAGWLARFARKRAEEERETLELGLERELQSACPPREVRSFCVLLMRDACATRRPARRVAELTAWDVLTLSFDESPAGKFKEGQRFQVTNLFPTQKSAWMDRGVEGGHVYLSTSKTSRWIKLSGS